jgi:carbon starvation protein
MTLALLALPFVALLALGYRFHAARVARVLDLDDARATPAVARRDDVDYVPAGPFYLFAQHFSAIAAAGPIAGPILACKSFGWLPCLLWIGLGVVFIGAVHDFAILAASVRHDGRSIIEVARKHLGGGAGRAFLAFIWIALVYVVVAFADITAGSFVVGTEELRGGAIDFHPGGAVAAASVLYLGVALAMGIAQRVFRMPLWGASLLFVPAAFVAPWLGTKLSHVLVLEPRTWALLILGYCAVASVTPVWLLLQPRGYLGGFVLYAALALGVVGVLSGGFEVQQPAFAGFHAEGAGVAGALFPFLFVTIACGACSGFHGLVCSGTTSKQVSRESHVRPIGYGAMLAEGFVALVALVTIMIVAPADARGLAPGTIYGNGIGRFLALLVGEEHLAFAVTFGAMAFSTFVFDTLDVCTRLGRYVLQELFGWRGVRGALLATAVMIAAPAAVMLAATTEAWLAFWTLFGTSNQLLAGLSLLAVAVWLKGRGKSVRLVVVPALFLLGMTSWALLRLATAPLVADAPTAESWTNAAFAVVLVVLALGIAARAFRALRG